MEKKTFSEFCSLPQEEQQQVYEKVMVENGRFYKWWRDAEDTVDRLKKTYEERQEAVNASAKRIYELMLAMANTHNGLMIQKNETIKLLCSAKNMEELSEAKCALITAMLDAESQMELPEDILEDLSEQLGNSNNEEE